MNDNQFATTMMTIMGVLIALTVLIMVIANILIPKADYSQDSLVQGKIEDRIKPVGTLAIAGVTPVNANESTEAATTTTADAAGASKSGEQLYTACAACHNAVFSMHLSLVIRPDGEIVSQKVPKNYITMQ